MTKNESFIERTLKALRTGIRTGSEGNGAGKWEVRAEVTLLIAQGASVLLHICVFLVSSPLFSTYGIFGSLLLLVPVYHLIVTVHDPLA